MNKYIALLRGINVSGQRKIKMKELVSFLITPTFYNVNYYLQSGYLIFNSNSSKEKIKETIENIIEENYQFNVPVLILEYDNICQIIENNPFSEEDVKYMTTSIKADKEASVGTILDIKEQLRDINALKVSFSTTKGSDLKTNY